MAGRHVLHLHGHIGQPTGVLNVRSAYAGSEVPRHRLQSDGASTSGRQHSPEVTWSPSQRRCSVQCSVAAPDREQKTIQLEAVRPDENASSAAATSALLCDPESFTLSSGQLSTVTQEASQRPEDVFRCSGCSLQECQVQNARNVHYLAFHMQMLHFHAVSLMRLLQGPTGCAQMLWRNSLDGYLRQILNARVYDVAVRATVDLLTRHDEASLCTPRNYSVSCLCRSKPLLSKLPG